MNMFCKMTVAFVLSISANAHASECTQRTVPYSHCVENGDIVHTPLNELAYHADKVVNIGDVANVIINNVDVYAQPDASAPIVFSKKARSKDDALFDMHADVEVRIEGIEKDFYAVSIILYSQGLTCGFGAQAKITGLVKGYVPISTADGLPTLWNIVHMTGMC